MRLFREWPRTQDKLRSSDLMPLQYLSRRWERRVKALHKYTSRRIVFSFHCRSAQMFRSAAPTLRSVPFCPRLPALCTAPFCQRLSVVCDYGGKWKPRPRLVFENPLMTCNRSLIDWIKSTKLHINKFRIQSGIPFTTVVEDIRIAANTPVHP